MYNLTVFASAAGNSTLKIDHAESGQSVLVNPLFLSDAGVNTKYAVNVFVRAFGHTDYKHYAEEQIRLNCSKIMIVENVIKSGRSDDIIYGILTENVANKWFVVFPDIAYGGWRVDDFDKFLKENLVMTFPHSHMTKILVSEIAGLEELIVHIDELQTKYL